MTFISDVFQAFKRYQYWIIVSVFNLVAQYRKSILGPFWISGSIGIFVVLLGSLYALIFGIDPSEFLPYLAIGYITWHMIQGTITQSLKCYTRNKNYLLQSQQVIPVYNLQQIFEIALIFLHNTLVIIAVFAFYGRVPSLEGIGFFFLGLAVLLFTMIWVTVLMSVLGVLYRDLVEFIAVLMRIAFLATPIIWQMGRTESREAIENVMSYNPFYHYIEIVRAPLLDHDINPVSWFFVGGMTVFGLILTSFVYGRMRNRLAVLL